jgi:hypothetical protein
MSLIRFVASVRSRYQSQRNERDGVQIMNRLRELLEIEQVILKETKTIDNRAVPTPPSLIIR